MRSRIKRGEIYLVVAQSYERQRQNGFAPRKDCPPWPLEPPLDWAADPFDDPNWRSKLQHWRMTDPILNEYFKRREPDLLREALGYALDWHRFHFLERKLTPASWSDAGTGIRALRIAFFIDRIEAGELSVCESEWSAIVELADEHVRRLRDESFLATSNHGLFQAFGLKLLCDVMLDRPGCRDGAAAATAAFKTILGHQFDEHGVHREHSPAYHFFAAKLIHSLGGMRRFDAPEIRHVLAAAGECAPWLVFPDGREPRIGDSGGARRDLAPPKEPAVSLPDGRRFLVGDLTQSGYAIIRSEAGPSSESSMIFVTGMAHSATHKHADDLSFELFEHGRRIFVDSGKYGYFRDATRRYMKSAAAHNTISLRDTAIRPGDIRMEGSALASIESEGTAFRITGAIDRPGLFEQRRVLLYDPGRFLVVSDRVRAAQKRAFVSSLHLPPDLVPHVSETELALDLGNGSRIGASLITPGSVEALRGSKAPMVGWFSPSYGRAEPTTVVRATCAGRTRILIWAIWFAEKWRDQAVSQARSLEHMGDRPLARSGVARALARLSRLGATEPA